MKKVKLALVAGVVAILTVSPLAPSQSAFACPDPENPCDPPVIHPSDIQRFVICQIKNC